MPTSLIGGVLQAALLGAKDSVTPMVAILYSTIVNIVGDYLLVTRYHMALKGAAIATVAAQWAANYFISSTYPAMMEFSSAVTYWCYGVMSEISFFFVWKMVPETKGKSLEEMENLWTTNK